MFLQLSIGLCDARHGREASFAGAMAKRVPDTAGLVSIALTSRHQAINDLTRTPDPGFDFRQRLLQDYGEHILNQLPINAAGPSKEKTKAQPIGGRTDQYATQKRSVIPSPLFNPLFRVCSQQSCSVRRGILKPSCGVTELALMRYPATALDRRDKS